ncbi:MAG: AAA family ATPase [Deltaproteobacteria bacterium]|nr:AAA family ATPase [Deltaproteobacteria bacterium]
MTKTARPGALGQERAMRALDVGLGIRERGFNIFVVGAAGTGRTSTVRSILLERARKEEVPDDWALLYNFDDADRPRAVKLPRGTAHKLKREVDEMLQRLQQELMRAFEGDAYRQRRQKIIDRHSDQEEKRLRSVEKEAARRGFALQRSPTGLALGPATDGEPMTEEQFRSLPRKERQRLEQQGSAVEELLDDVVRQIRGLQRETDKALQDLDKEEVRRVVTPMVMEVAEAYREQDMLRWHFERVIDDLVEHTAELRPPDETQETPAEGQAPPGDQMPQRPQLLVPSADSGQDGENLFTRYRINALVDNRSQKGAPVIEETHPTMFNLMGRIEHRLRGGETITDFTRIKAGALHRANGGYLLIDAMELFREPPAYEALKRALKNRALEIEDAGEPGRMISIAALRPEPIPLQVKVIIVGTPDLYYQLSKGDPDFQKLFKIKADFDVEMDRTPERLRGFATFIVALAREEGLRRFDATGLARILEEAARLASDRKKLSTRFGEIADLVREASFWATRRRSRVINLRDVTAALDARRDRERYLEDRLREAVKDGSIRIDSEGAVVGQVNGLTVVELGSYSFGHPSRITARVHVGKGGVIDVEREVDLGGPIHSKGVIILQAILGDRFGKHAPLTLGATLCMEQNYSEVEGDSASLAECLALLSALSGVPLRQGMAVTGSIDQLGHVQTVGGVNEKIEGYFDTCQALGGKPGIGVVMPVGNVSELMLRDDVVEAVARKRFTIHAVRTLEEAVEITMGAPLGAADAHGHFPPGCVGAACRARLDGLHEAWLASRGRKLDPPTPRRRSAD